MPNLAVQSFKYGIDFRRDQLVNQPGTMVKIENGHVTEGGEVIKRFGFYDAYGVLAAGKPDLTNTLGLVAVDGGLVTFAAFGSSVPNAGSTYPSFTASANGVPPTSVMLLKHPNSLIGLIAPLLTAIVDAKCFKGYPLCIAKWSDGNYFIYYGGYSANSPVPHSFEGQVFDSLTSGANLAALLDLQISFDLPGWTHTVTSNYVDLKSPTAITGVAMTPADTDPNRNVSVQHVAGFQGNTPAAPAIASFKITAAGNAGDVWTLSITTVGTVATYTVLTGDSTTQVVAGLALSFNGTVTTPQYTCAVNTDTMTVYGPAGDTSINGKVLTVATTGTGNIDGPSGNIVLSPDTISASRYEYATTSVKVTGLGVPGDNNIYHFEWTYQSGSTEIKPFHPTWDSKLIVNQPYGSATYVFPAYFWNSATNLPTSATYIVKVTNGTGLFFYSSPITVQFHY